MIEVTIEDLAITTVLRENLTQSDGDAVLSTTWLKDSRSRQAREQKLLLSRSGVNVRSSAPPRRAVRNGVKNLHGSKTIPKSR
jgi:hypothetical protein